MINVEKIAVFDLDGTLWNVNSHLEILNQYYHTHFYTSLYAKMMFHIVPKQLNRLIWCNYSKIPKEYVFQYRPCFRKSAIELLNLYKKQGYMPLIISNAPYEIVKGASERLNADFLCTRPGEKLQVLNQIYTYKILFVCTDNMSDCDLLDCADIQVVYPHGKRNYRFFKKRYPDIQFMEE